MAELDDDQKNEYMEAFQTVDEKNHGRIDSKKLQELMRYLGNIISFNECNDIVQQHGSAGTIDRDAFVRFMTKKTVQNDTEEDLIMAFKVFDKDGKGFVTSSELRFILGSLGDRLNDEETESLVNQADPGGGGQINYTQFVRSMYQAIQGR